MPDRERQATNKAFRIFLLGLEEVLGVADLAAALRLAGLPQYIDQYPPATPESAGHKSVYISQIAQAVHAIYGARGSKAILQRVGRTQAQLGIVENQKLVNVTRAAIKLAPPSQQIKLVLETAARAMREQVGDEIFVAKDWAGWYYEARTCCYCAGWQSDAAVCHAGVGLLNGLLGTLLGDATITVDEITCRARGESACRYRVRARTGTE